METVKIGDKILILDGAHNGQKLHTLIASIRAKYPHQKVAALVSFVAEREGRVGPGVQELVQLADYLILSSFSAGQDTSFGSVPPEEIAAACRAVGFTDFETQPSSKAALAALLKRPEPILLVAGSFYMLGQIHSGLHKTANY